MTDSLADQQNDRTGRLDGEAEIAAVVSKYLPSGYSADPEILVLDGPGSGSAPGRSTSGSDPLESQPQESSLKLLGGDIHRDIYRINARANKRHPGRSATLTGEITGRSAPDASPLSATEQRAPGGFRRQFVLQRRNRLHTFVTRRFVDFLDLFGSFAGEDLAEPDDESVVNELPQDERLRHADETSPLLGSRKLVRRATERGDASNARTFFTLLKAFIGTGIMFLPKAFNNGGIVFSSITLVAVAAVTCICFRLLLDCRQRHGGGGYGDIGEKIVGSWLKSLILFSITISQIGFVCSGIIFTAENLYIFFEAVIRESAPLSLNALIGIQLLALIPLSLIRNISKLGPVALVADVFILFGLTYIWYYDISTISKQGMHHTVQLFNSQHYTLTIGSSIFTYEGIGLVLPIQSSMKEPEKFPQLLYIVMLIITVIFTSVGALSYATFGTQTRTEIISNFPQTSNLVHVVQFLYSLAILVGTPVQLFPAVRILEGKLFGHLPSGAYRHSIKWKKNAFRTGIVLLSGVIAALGASDLDKFVALIGSFACVPLVYIYPAYLHYKGVATSRSAVLGDILLIVGGAIAAAFTTTVTLVRWIEE